MRSKKCITIKENRSKITDPKEIGKELHQYYLKFYTSNLEHKFSYNKARRLHAELCAEIGSVDPV